MKVYYNNKRYSGKAYFINGYNGYTKTKEDSFLCAVINGSVWNEEKIPNYLTDEEGNKIHSENKRGNYLEL